MGKAINFDDVLITQVVADAWQECTQRLSIAILAIGVRPEEIPIEQLELLPDGSLRLFAKIEGVCEASLQIPPDHWTWAPHRTN
jgi:hypothetical protein